MSGLLSGLLLRRAGWDVDIYERVESELSGRGAGIVAQQELIARLRGLGLAHRRPRRADHHPQDPRRAGAASRSEIECPQVLTAWERVYRLLRDAFPPEHYHRGRGLTGFTQDADEGDARIFPMAKTSRPICWSAPTASARPCASNAVPDVAPLYAGYSAWRALIAESDFPADVHRELFEFMTFGLPPGEQFLGYPVAGPDNDLRPGHRRYNVVWYRPADETTKLPWLLTDESGHDACDLDPAAADPPRGDRRNARRRRAAAGAAVPPDRAADRRADPAADLRSGIAAHGVRPRRDRRRCRIRRAAACRRPACRRRRTTRRRWPRRSAREPMSRRRSSVSRRRGCRENHRIIERARHLGAYLAGDAARRKSRRAPAGTRPTTR